MVVDALYDGVTDAGKGVSVPFTFDSKIIDRALQNIRNGRIDARRQIDPGLFSEVSRILDTAVRTGYDAPAGSPGSGFAREIRRNTEVFSAFKAHRMGRDMASQLLDENGQIRSFREFRKATEDIVDHHVNSWLRTEYDTAVKRAHHAAEMRQFISEADVFPNIEWLPSTAVKPREQHMPFYHHVWPVNDPFWSEHKPGDEWGCQCGWRSTDSPVTDNSGLGGNDIAPPSPGLGGDPAATGEVFSQDHPYFPSDCSRCAFYKPGFRDRLRHLFTARAKDCYDCPYLRACINKLSGSELRERNHALYESLKKDTNYENVKFDNKSGGMSANHKKHNFSKTISVRYGFKCGKFEEFATEALMNDGHSVVLSSENAETGVKTPDGYLDGLLMDIKAVEGTGRWTIKTKFYEGVKQGVACVVMYFHEKALFSEDRMTKGWELFLDSKDAQRYPQSITKVVCVVENEVFEWVIPK